MNRFPLWAGMFATLAILALVYVLDRHEQWLVAQRNAANLERDAAAVGMRIEGLLTKHLYLAEGLASVVAARNRLSSIEFNRLARGMAEDHDLVHSVFLRRHDGEVMHATSRYSAALETILHSVAAGEGHDRHLASVSAPIKTGVGGSLLWLRVPINLPSGQTGTELSSYWGTVGVLLDGEELLRRVGLVQEAPRMLLAIRAWHEGRPVMVHGEAAVFDTATAMQEVRLPQGVWRVGAQPLPGAISETILSWPRLMGVLLALVIGVLFYAVLYERQVMRRMALHDALTGLPNRLLLQDRLQQCCAVASRAKTALVLMYLDLDNFKPVNDMYGHMAGDQVLCEVARRLRGCVRRTDTVARVSGDEFVIVLSGLEEPLEAERVADKILTTFSQPILAAGQPVRLGSSIGLYQLDGSCDVDEALLRADRAMYEAKHDGKNDYRWYLPTPEQLELEVAAAKVA